MSTSTAEFTEVAPKLQPRRGVRMYWIVLLIVWAASAVYMGTHLLRGWVPHDEGTYAQSAERILYGQLPHRDFSDLYTGGLTYLHALAFRFFGINLATLRYVLFAAFLAWVPAVYYIASRLGSPWAAGAVTFLCVVWSVPNYSAAAPSWYNLFFATFGVAALLRRLEKQSGFWIFIAGLCGGLSCLVKIAGLYFLAAVWLFLIFREQSLALAAVERPKRASVFRVFTLGSTLLVVVFLVFVIHKRNELADILYFVVPAAALCSLIFLREIRGISRSDSQRFRRFTRLALPFIAGAALPILSFLLVYILKHSVHALFEGVFIRATRHIQGSAMSLPPLWHMLAVLPFPVWIVLAAKSRGRVRLIIHVLAVAGLVMAWFTSEWMPPVYAALWLTAYFSPPLVVVAGAAILHTRTSFGLYVSELREQQLFLLLSAAALCSVVQFPFAAAIYFCYIAPLVVLALMGVVLSFDRWPKFPFVTLLLFYVLFGATRVTPSFIYAMGENYQPDIENTPLHLDRGGGLRVMGYEAAVYEQLISLVRSHAAGSYIYAAPDCPEVYFLSGLRNPTPWFFEFLDVSADDTESILATLDANQVSVVVINQNPSFSGELPEDFRNILRARFPSFRYVQRFEVRWRSKTSGQF